MGGRSHTKDPSCDRDSALARSPLCDIDDPRKLPLCWYGVPFVDSLVFGFAERVGLASYYDKPNLRLKAGDLDIFETWARLEVWFKKKSGLKLDWILVWGERFPILTFWSNHELLRITKDMWGDVCDLIDDMGYGREFELMWYLDRSLDALYCLYPSFTCDDFSCFRWPLQFSVFLHLHVDYGAAYLPSWRTVRRYPTCDQSTNATAFLPLNT
ncbi:hypothetical protein LXA43DRAFT_705843 [Ganoderma leucocontextum]|nr:hypothetical protein LXA43DRAFT_705843 [Ganoderma leucocontextum]